MSICKDCFHSYVCEQFNEHREWDNKKCHFANDHFVPADLINCLQAEIERLKVGIDKADAKLSEYEDHMAKKQADIVMLNKEIISLQELCETKTALLTDANYSLLTAKSEARKEFAERVKEIDLYRFIEEYYQNAELRYEVRRDWFDEHIDNLLKEMEGNNND